MFDSKKSYREIILSTSLFGGVQFFNILIQLIKTKVIAVLLGTEGMGVMGLLNSSLGFMVGSTNFGIGQSAVKDVAIANSSGDIKRRNTVISVLRRILWITGLFGTFLTIILASWLSELTFGNDEYKLAFVWISSAVLFTQLSSGQLVILQGLRKLKLLAKANLIGSIVGLFVTIPLYYYYGYDGIVPGIIVTALSAYIVSWYFVNKLKIKSIKVNYKEVIHESKDMIQLGLSMSFVGILALGTAFLIRIFISRVGSLSEVGLYTAGFTIINRYVGLIFTAMSKDYYPRLSEVSDDNSKIKKIVNQQAEVAILILGPILLIFLTFINWIVVILYSAEFTSINNLLYWATLGIIFKAISWSISYIFLAKGAGRTFVLNELVSSIYFLSFNLLGYYYYGLSGLGVAFTISYLTYTFQVYFVSRKKFKFGIEHEFIPILRVQITLVFLGFLNVILLDGAKIYFIGVLLTGFSVWYSYKKMSKRINLSGLLKKGNKN